MKKALKDAVPKHRRHLITQNFCDTIENMSDPDFREAFKDNMFRFADVWDKHNRVGLKSFANAILFCTHRLLGDTQAKAYCKTFPDRYERLMNEGKEMNVATMAAAYCRHPLICDIMERSLVPVYLLNADLHQEAINVQADLMRTAKSENVRMKAAECLIMNLKPPEDINVNVNVDHRSSQLEELREVTRKLAEEQKRAIQDGRVNAQQIAESEIIDVKLLDQPRSGEGVQ